MSTLQNRQFKLTSRPVGMVKRSDFEFVTTPAAEPGPGEALVKVLYLSLDPAMRGWMNAGRSYIPPVGLGDVMRAGGIGRVVASNDPSAAVGDTVVGMTGVQDYAIAKAKDLTKVDPRLAPLPRYLGALGMPGLTAYFGLLDIGQPKEGETVVVSAAAGAVGAVTGQIAKIKGCRVIGIAGGPDKCRYVAQDLGFDAAIDYKNEDVRAALARHCPKGVDIYFDNVGGEILDIALSMLASRARVIICGAISQYNNPESIQGPRNYLSLLINHARMEGFVVFDYAARYPEGMQALAGWMFAGKLKAREDIVEGLETFPDTLQKLFRGENFGHGRHRRHRGVSVLAHHHVDHDRGDVVAATVGACRPDQQLGRPARVGNRREHLGELGGVQLVGEAVAAQQVPVTPDRLDLPQIDGHLGRHAEGPGQDVPIGMHRGLCRGHLTGPDHLLGQAVVGGDLDHLAVVKPVGARIADVDQGQDVVAVLVDHGHGGQRGAHAAQLGVLLAALPDHSVGLGDRFGQPGPGRLASERHPEGLDGQSRGNLTPGVAAHPVGHREQAGRLDGQVLVDGPDQAGIGGRARPEERHLTSPPRTRCRPPAAGHPFRAWCARRCARCSPRCRWWNPGPPPTGHRPAGKAGRAGWRSRCRSR